MTQLLKEPEQQDEGLTWSKLGSLPMPLLNDFRDTLHDFWGQTFSPVARMLSQTVAILWKQALIPAVQNWISAGWQRLSHGMLGKGKVKKGIQEVSVPASMNLRKIHGALGERWSAEASERPIRLSAGKENPWIAAEKRTIVLKPRNEKAQIGSKLAKDEIRGLDDIFTKPVQGSFLDVINKQGHSDKPKPLASMEKNQPKITSVEPNEATELSRMAALAQTQELLREEALKLGSRVKNIAESTKDWFAKQDSAFAEVTAQLAEKAPAPYHSYVNEAVPVFAPAAPIAETPVLKPQKSVVAPEMVIPVEAPVPIKVEAVASKPMMPAKPKPPELTYELADDLDGLDYRLRNNRILSNSISNLVDRYFHQASQEEEPSYY